MVSSKMLLSVYHLPHSGRDEDDHIETQQTVRTTLTENRKAGAVEFFVGGGVVRDARFSGLQKTT